MVDALSPRRAADNSNRAEPAPYRVRLRDYLWFAAALLLLIAAKAAQQA